MLLIPLLLAAGTAPAQDEDEAPRDEPPSLELLEFLADWETDDGQWIDPRHLGLEAPPSPARDPEEDDHGR